MLTDDLSDGFFRGLHAVAGRLGCAPRDLVSVMMSESAVTATAENPWGGASGLVQFMPSTLEALGWTNGPAAFRQLSAEHQLEWVEKYFAVWKGFGLTSPARLYQATFLPATLEFGSAPETVLVGRDNGPFAWAYEPNFAFDREGKGTITVGDLSAAIDRQCTGPRWDEVVSRLAAADPASAGRPGSGDVDAAATAEDVATVTGLQQALTRLGYAPGPADGAERPELWAALSRFRAGNGVAEVIGPETRAALEAALSRLGAPSPGNGSNEPP